MTNLEAKTNQLASQVISGEALDSFLKLDIDSKLLGLQVLAHLGSDTKMEAAVAAIGTN